MTTEPRPRARSWIAAIIMASALLSGCGPGNHDKERAVTFANVDEAERAAIATIYELAAALGAGRDDVDAAFREPGASGPGAGTLPCEVGMARVTRHIQLPRPPDLDQAADAASAALTKRFGGGRRDVASAPDGRRAIYLSGQADGLLGQIDVTTEGLRVRVKTDCAADLAAP